jgi:DNA-binding beta-propeller fold protein YncE
MILVRLAALAALSCPIAFAVAPALAAEPAAGTAYVSNQNGNISIIDLATMKVTGGISPYGKEPRGIGVTADGKLLVVANREGGRIAVIDRESRQLLRYVAIGANPEFVRTRGHLAFVSFEPESTGQAPMRPVGASEAPAPAAEGGASAGKGGGKDDDDDKKELAQVAVVDLDKGKVLRSIVSGHETEGIEFAADGKHILVTNEADDNVAVHDIATGKQVKEIDTKPYGKRPRGVKRSPDGKTYVVTLEFANAFIVLDDHYDVVKTVKTADSPYGVSFNRAGDRLFVAAAKSKVLQVFDTKTWALVKDVPIGSRCWHFTFTPDDKNILLACGRSDEVVVVDAVKLEPVEHIADKELPWGIVTYPKSMGSLDRPE